MIQKTGQNMVDDCRQRKLSAQKPEDMLKSGSVASMGLLKLLSYVTIGKSGFGRSIGMKENIVQKLTSKDDNGDSYSIVSENAEERDSKVLKFFCGLFEDIVKKITK